MGDTAIVVAWGLVGFLVAALIILGEGRRRTDQDECQYHEWAGTPLTCRRCGKVPSIEV